MWGKARLQNNPLGTHRIIPTDVGKSACFAWGELRRSDHPHGCGEKVYGFNFLACLAGSSPRMWGKGKSKKFIRKYSRIIPTDVGKSNQSCFNFFQISDHPHGCGEKFMITNSGSFFFGSSPRMWGKVFDNFEIRVKIRIIPTDVGKRFHIASTRVCNTDHPHGCGEKNNFIFFFQCDFGSSPRMWGKVSKKKR